VRPAAVAYILLTVALVAMWQQGSVEGIGIVAAFILALTALESGGFTRLKAGEPTVNAELEKVIERMEMAATVAAGEPGAPDDMIKSRPELVARQAEADRRTAVERLVKDAATWGWLTANIGSPTPPEPRVEWDGDGIARIVHAEPALPQRQARVRRRPQAVERARKERDTGGMSDRS
jgi:hypothetical protein